LRHVQTQDPQNRLKELRERDGLKLHEVSTIVGRGESVVWRYEKGLTAVPDDAKLKLAEHYGVTVEYLMGWDLRVEEGTAA
jgi:transcriptional regulator with XRE-family HTH domain